MIFCRLHTLHGEMHITMPLHESLLSSSIVAHYNQYSQCMSLSKTELLCYLRMKGDTLRSRNAVCHICASIRSTLLASSRHHSSIINNFTNTMTCNLPRWRRINFSGMTSHEWVGCSTVLLVLRTHRTQDSSHLRYFGTSATGAEVSRQFDIKTFSY